MSKKFKLVTIICILGLGLLLYYGSHFLRIRAEKTQILKIFDTYIEAHKTENIDLFMSLVSSRDYEAYKLRKKLIQDLYDTYEDLSITFSKIKIRIKGNEATAQVHGVFKYKTKSGGGAESSSDTIYTFAKEEGRWKIVGIEHIKPDWQAVWEKEMRYFQKSLAKNPNPSDYLSLGGFAKQAKRYEEAKEAYQKVIDLYPDSTETDSAYYDLGIILFKVDHDYGKALEQFQILVSKYPDSHIVKAGFAQDWIKRCEEKLQKVSE